MTRADPLVVDFEFGTKAETLERLSGLLAESIFCPQLFFDAKQWRERSDELLDAIVENISADQLAVRSSCQGEDGADASFAGAFHSVIGVANSAEDIRAAVIDVFASYGRACDEDQVLVQPCISDVAISGVLTTRQLDTGAPYYVVNYDDATGRTDSVTSGDQSKTILVHRARYKELSSSRILNLIETARTVEDVTGSSALDIEFCTTHDGQLYILQVRPLAASKGWDGIEDRVVGQQLERARHCYRELSGPDKDVSGAITIFGQMPDWNPAEIIGQQPRPLAYSLYRTLITDGAWAEARYRMGYRDLRGKALMQSFAGRPYIDVRRSLNSFLPVDLPDSIVELVIAGQLARLADHREYHDRIEFKVAIPNLDFDFEARVPELREAGLSAAQIDEFRGCLSELTCGLVENGAEQLALLEADTEALIFGKEAGQSGETCSLVAQMDNCRTHGTIPFSMLARHGFVGVSFLRSLVARRVLSEVDVNQFIATVHTVAAEFVSDLSNMHGGRISRDVFLERYGHLRPGTYDIASERYDANPDFYLSGQRYEQGEQHKFSLSSMAQRGIDERLKEAGINADAQTFLHYISEGIRLRELAKFRFTRSLSSILESIASWGAEHDLSRDDVSFLTVEDVLAGDGAQLKPGIAQARGRFEAERLVYLPHLIIDQVDFDIVRVPLNTPTFITKVNVVAPAVREFGTSSKVVDGSIVMIESADPGFDWIFSHNIAGLITKYGGANSHMAIRCAEFGLPAAIGCGERLYSALAKGRLIELNCASQIVRVLS